VDINGAWAKSAAGAASSPAAKIEAQTSARRRGAIDVMLDAKTVFIVTIPQLFVV